MLKTKSFIDSAEVDYDVDLNNISFFAKDLELSEKQQSLEFYRKILLIRKTEELIAKWVSERKALTPCHLAIGQEAVAVGVSSDLTNLDRVFGNHRSHGHYLALGAPVQKLLAEVLGKETGCSRGRGGSQHLVAKEYGFWGSVPIVAATIPIAVGAALALKKDGSDSIAVSYFGDGASEEGIFHESLNMAKMLKAPVLFVCENNLFSSHLDLKFRQPSHLISRFALAHRIKSLLVDGNNVQAVSDATKELKKYIQSGNGPAFMEAITFRHCGHVGPNHDLDVGVLRNKDNLTLWKSNDPLLRLENAIIATFKDSKNELTSIKAGVLSEIKEAADYAESSSFPEASKLLRDVYA